MSEDIFGCHSGMGDATSVLWVEAKDSVKHAIMHRALPPSQRTFQSRISRALRLRKTSVLDKGKT